MPARKKAQPKAVPPKTARQKPASSSRRDYRHLVAAIHLASKQTVRRAAVVVNQWLVIRNWLVGAYLVEYEQNGSDRANYGAKLLERLAQDLSARGAGGLSPVTLGRSRMLFFTYPQLAACVPSSLMTESFPKLGDLQIPSSVMTELPSGVNPPNIEGPPDAKSNTSIPISCAVTTESKIRQTLSVESRLIPSRWPNPGLPTPLSPHFLLQFSWTKLQELLRLDDPWKRAFYENECLKGNWSVRQLQRQIETLLYERTGLSTNKKALVERARKQEPQETIEDLIRDPYVLEFAGLADRPAYSENDLETALLDHLQRFLLELGNGFCFEARQYRITTGNRHHRVDLVFYHRLLRCHILIDLKIRAFKHDDAGQMNFYVNWFKKTQMQKGDHPPVGIILCSGKDHTDVEFATAGMDAKLFVSRYLVALPSVQQLKAQLEADRARIEQR